MTGEYLIKINTILQLKSNKGGCNKQHRRSVDKTVLVCMYIFS